MILTRGASIAVRRVAYRERPPDKVSERALK